MQQMMHIFRKDVRSLLPQIALSLLLLAAYVWSHAGERGRLEYGVFGWFIVFNEYGGFLVVLGWLALVVRSVLEEPLVGDRQFWVTRPYEWKSLLGAKLLFILLFVSLPLLIAQLLLLAASGFSPFPHLGDLLLIQLYDALLIVLPALVAASVSTSVGRTIFVSLGAILYAGVVAYLMPSTPSTSASNQVEESVSLIVLIGGALLVIYWQYSARAMMKSARLIAAVAVGLPLLSLFSLLAPWDKLMAREFPVLQSGSTPAFAFRLDSSHPPAPKIEKVPEKVDLDFPVLTGLPDGVFLNVQHARLRLEGNGRTWDSGWDSANQDIYPGENRFTLSFQLPRSIFEALRNADAKAEIWLAISEYKASNTRTLVARDELTIPNVGPCRLEYGRMFNAGCVAATRRPAMLITVPASTNTCPVPKGEEKVTRYAWQGENSPDPGIDPVQIFGLWFRTGVPVRDELNQICPGTQMLLSDINPVRSFQVDMPEQNIRIEDFRRQDVIYTDQVVTFTR